jgi:hypothetical protein
MNFLIVISVLNDTKDIKRIQLNQLLNELKINS